MGYMMAWLLQAGLPAAHPAAVACRDEHVHGKAGKAAPRDGTRSEARAALMLLPNAADLGQWDHGGVLADGAEPELFTPLRSPTP